MCPIVFVYLNTVNWDFVNYCGRFLYLFTLVVPMKPLVFLFPVVCSSIKKGGNTCAQTFERLYKIKCDLCGAGVPRQVEKDCET